jgi:hypothetical protein
MTGDNEIEITVDVDDSASGKLDKVGDSAETMGSRVRETLEGVARSSTRMGEEVVRSTDRVRDSRGRFIKSGQEAAASEKSVTSTIGKLWSDFANIFSGDIGDLASNFGKFGQSIGQAVGQMFASEAASTVASDGLNLLVGAVMALAGAVPLAIGGFLALGPALLAVGGAAGAATSILAGLGVAMGALFVGLSGVGKAWTAYGQQAAHAGGASSGAGQAAAAAARAVENAEYSLTQAKRAATKASEDLAKARENERVRLEELSLQLRGQKFAEADAAKAVKDAEAQLAWARIYGSEQAKKEAQDALDRAKLNYDEQHEKLVQLQKEQDKANKDGVEGSDQVVAAKDRVRDSQEQVTRAAHALADAQHNVGQSTGGAAGGVNAFADAMAKLSPNARAFVRELISLSERFDKIKRQVQDHLFAGLDKSLENLAQKWLPVIGPMLDNMADALNSVAKNIMGALGNNDFIKGITEAAKGFADVLKHDIGPAVSHLIHAFGIIAGDSVGPMKEMAGWILQIADAFDKWVTKAHKTGELKDFMHQAAATLKQIWDIGKLAFKIVGQIIEILFPSSSKEGTGVLDSVESMLTKISKWLNDPKNQQKIKDWINKAIEFAHMMINAGVWVANLAVKFARFASDMATKLHNAKNSWNDFWNGIKSGFRDAINWIIDRWNSLHFTIPGFSFLGQQIGGISVGVGHLNHFATGGAGSGRIVAGENGPEVIDLQAGRVWAASNSRRMLADPGQGGEHGGTPLVVQLLLDGRIVQEALIEPTRRFVQQRFGGSVQSAYGR